MNIIIRKSLCNSLKPAFNKEARMDSAGKLELKATIEIMSNPELYKLIDFLNKNLKDSNIIFGLSKKDDKMKISIYET